MVMCGDAVELTICGPNPRVIVFGRLSIATGRPQRAAVTIAKKTEGFSNGRVWTGCRFRDRCLRIVAEK